MKGDWKHRITIIWHEHYGKSLAIWLFVQQLVYINNRENVHITCTCLLLAELVDSPHNGPTMRKGFPFNFQNVFMTNHSPMFVPKFTNHKSPQRTLVSQPGTTGLPSTVPRPPVGRSGPASVTSHIWKDKKYFLVIIRTSLISFEIYIIKPSHIASMMGQICNKKKSLKTNKEKHVVYMLHLTITMQGFELSLVMAMNIHVLTSLGYHKGLTLGMMTSSNGKIFCVTGPLCEEFTSHLV